jgi:hypothetical protein
LIRPKRKAAAEKTAKDTDGVTKVVNQLKVAPAAKATPKQSGKTKPELLMERRHPACGSCASCARDRKVSGCVPVVHIQKVFRGGLLPAHFLYGNTSGRITRL